MDATPRQTLKRMNKVLASLTDARQKELFTIWRDHWWAEVVCDIDAIMATLAPNPTYRTYGSTVFGKMAVDTTAEARQIYAGVIDRNLSPAGILDGERFAFGDWGMVCEAIQYGTMPGSFLADPRYQDDRCYLVTLKFISLHPYDWDKRLLTGEIAYLEDPLQIREINRNENPNFVPGAATFAERDDI